MTIKFPPHYTVFYGIAKKGIHPMFDEEGVVLEQKGELTNTFNTYAAALEAATKHKIDYPENKFIYCVHAFNVFDD